MSNVDKYLGLKINPPKNGKREREVAIIGVGHTPWLLAHKDPDWEGTTEPEMFAYFLQT